MATIESLPARSLERPRRSRPFSSWVRKLTSFKSSSSQDALPSTKKNAYQMKSHSLKKTSRPKNNPYMAAVQGHASSTAPVNTAASFSTAPTGRTASAPSIEHSRRSVRSSQDDHSMPAGGVARSVAQTTSTMEHGTSQSQAASSGANTAMTPATATGRGEDSTFSSPAPSVRSLTTTLTTIQSTIVPTIGSGSHNQHGHLVHNTQPNTFSHQFPSSPLPTAIPAHLVTATSGGHPSTYTTATANNLLTDNASILTLASSSKRRRRRSMDTDASVRALAPSSLFGGSRESLPLSVLSSNVDHLGPPASVFPSARSPLPIDRASIYSSTGVAPALSSDRNSYYAGKQHSQSILSDGGSIKSGFLGHGRTDSVSGSIGGGAMAVSSPLASPKDGIVTAAAMGRMSRSNSAWGDTMEDHAAEAEEEERAANDAESRKM